MTARQIDREPAEILSEGRSIRRRANMSTSVQGVWTWECTVDMTGYTNEELLEQLDALTVALESRCLLQNDTSAD